MSGLDDDNLRADLNALLDGALSEERVAELLALIESDADVRREYEALRRVVEAVRGLPREHAPAQLRQRLRSVTAARRPAPILRWAMPLAAAAAVLVAVMLATRKEPVEDLPDQARADKDTVAEPGLLAGKETAKKSNVARDDDALEETAKEDAPPTDADAGDEEEAGRPTEMDDGSKKSEARPRKRMPKGGKGKPAAEAKTIKDAEKPEKEGKDPVAVVQAGAPIGTSADLKAYLRELSGHKGAAIVKHIASFGVSANSGARELRKARQKAKGGSARSGAALSTRLANKEEARLVSDVLKRAFPLMPVGTKKRSSGVGGAGGGGEASAPSPTATVENREQAKLILQVRVTPLQARTLRSWLDRLSVAMRGKRAGEFPRARPSGAIAGVVPARLRVELHYPPSKTRRQKAESDD